MTQNKKDEKIKEENSYRKEASTRVLYFSLAFVSSLIAATIAGVIIAAIFGHSDPDKESRIFVWVTVIFFAVICSTLVYKIDKKFTKRFDQNPK